MNQSIKQLEMAQEMFKRHRDEAMALIESYNQEIIMNGNEGRVERLHLSKLTHYVSELNHELTNVERAIDKLDDEAGYLRKLERLDEPLF